MPLRGNFLSMLYFFLNEAQLYISGGYKKKKGTSPYLQEPLRSTHLHSSLKMYEPKC